jgi:transposase
MLYVGVDSHKEKVQLTVVNEVGKIVGRHRVDTARDEIHRVLYQHDQPIKAVLEACYNWGPVYDWLDEISDHVTLAHPAKVRAIAEARIKTDKIDSAILAHLLRADLIPEAYAPNRSIRAVKRVLRQRLFLVRMRTMLKNRIHALLVQHSVERPEMSDLYAGKGIKWLKSVVLPSPDGELLSEDLLLLETLNERIAASEGLIRNLSKDDEVVTWLASMPGIGNFFSVLIRYEIDNIERFSTPKKLASYTGLVPSTYSSGAHTYHGRITKQGNKWLRWAFIEAVSPAIRGSSSLRNFYNRIKQRRGTQEARVATARKLAEIVWHVLKECRCYEER